MNETIKTMLERRSIRAYRPDALPKKLIDEIIKCGLFAATARGLQPWHLTVVTNRDLLNRISNATDPARDIFYGAPCVIIASYEQENEMFGEIDCANAVENMAVAAKSLDLGSCYIACFRRAFLSEAGEALKEACGIPAGYKPTLCLAVGYADGGNPGERAPRREGTVNWVE